ncbi:ABC transporter ATP-binding protein [Rhizobium sp. VS19-DR104.2]|uniref:ABC transporter ATP-binding protein n=1 Tax=unclassified Rhizobium TaxID=2613769 RepID=UPI001C5BC29C|nr:MULTISPECIES: ABC transporter ATP-binding protein [unclassified Rhizobium]MBZ5762384.1 ABC transporter ATP-binding protein [Rhizobium sp. VS19-DR96]MBZ5769136.1 ABC transporter ATP-binding protein [Rhizobium sp. VS19-DR129.2]MBZ5775964.1 ABC transporter ATP-binding protein [Rhizobium sp. VS19-DRK62.2]MBZ5786272.1 ABC transporter ATP-binding protein [Rhizobium sp. VS19-DR121]MBZ5804266.1 ABC transporter ATP-binding protein [Rhizobium sp. VS19-DR181]
MSQIRLEKTSKVFGATTVIPPLDLEIGKGEFVVFVGPSGSGKSTLLRLIAGLEEASGGKISIEGRDVTNVPCGDRGLAMVFQSYALYPHLTVRQNMSFPLEMAGESKEAIVRRIDETAQILDLTRFLERRPAQLSGGQRQRVAIGRAIVRNPTAFLFDEPLSNLDASLRGTMRLEIMKLHHQLGATMIYVTHDQVEAMTMADRIVVLNHGKIEQVGTPQELYERPANRFVAEFIGAPRMNRIDGAAAAALGAATIGVRPEHIRVNQDGGLWPATVEVIENLGAESYIHARSDAAGALVVRVQGLAGVKVGERIGLSPTDGFIHRFDDHGLAMR